MKAYKGFTKRMTCKGFQFKEGETYECKGEVKLCKSGFHACLNPLECWDYYDILNSEFHEVALDGVSDERENNRSKVVSRKITVGAKLDIKSMVEASVNFVLNSVKKETTGKETDGAVAQIGSSGDLAKIGSSGDWAKIGSSGNGAQIGSSGDGAQISSSGDGAKIDAQGSRCVIACAGNNCRIRGKEGSWIVLAEWKNVDGQYTPVCVKCAQVDGKKIKENTWYTLRNGEFVVFDEV